MIPLRDANPTHRTPFVTLALIVGCVVAFAWELGVLGSGGDPALERFFGQYGVVPARLTGALAGEGDLGGAALAVLTSLFLHGGWLHLGGNLLYLWIFGNNVEDRLGHAAFLFFYLAGGIAAVAAQVAIEPDSDLPMVGASGAIAAALGAYLVLFPRARILSLVFLGFFYQLIQVPARELDPISRTPNCLHGAGGVRWGGSRGTRPSSRPRRCVCCSSPGRPMNRLAVTWA